MSDNKIVTGKPKTFKFGKGKGEIKKTYETTFNPSGQIISQKVTKYDREGEIKKIIKPPLTAKTPYMMHGKKAAPMMGGSPLAKYGCSRK